MIRKRLNQGSEKDFKNNCKKICRIEKSVVTLQTQLEKNGIATWKEHIEIMR